MDRQYHLPKWSTSIHWISSKLYCSRHSEYL